MICWIGGLSYNEEVPIGVKSKVLVRSTWIGGALGVTLIIGAYLLSKGTGRTFIADEWMFVAARREIAPSTLFADHNGHLVALPAFLYMVVFGLVGLDGYRLLAVLAVLAHLVTALFIVRYLHRRCGAAVAIGAGLVVALSGAGAQNYVWGFQITFIGSVVFFLLAVVAYDRRDVSGRWRVATCVLVIGSLCFSGVGVSALATMAVVIVALGRLRRDWWVFVIPAVFYGSWYLRFAEQTPNARASIGQIARFILDGSAGSISATFGVDVGWGRLGLGLLLAWMVVDARRRGFVPRRYVWFVFSLFFWTITAFSRAGFGDPFSSRYLWVGQICLVLTIGELFPLRRVEFGRARVWGVAVLLVFLSFFGSRSMFVDNARFQSSTEDVAVARSTLALMNRTTIADEVAIHSIWGYTLITASDFFEAVERFGRPRTFENPEILADPNRRVAADVAMIEFGLVPVDVENVRCENVVATEAIMLDLGESASFRIDSSSNAVVRTRRFANVDEVELLPQRQIDSGVYTVRTFDDSMGLPVELIFDSPVMLCE